MAVVEGGGAVDRFRVNGSALDLGICWCDRRRDGAEEGNLVLSRRGEARPLGLC